MKYLIKQKRNEVVLKLNRVNGLIKDGVCENPAKINSQGHIEIVGLGGSIKTNQIIKLVGEWNFKEETKRIDDLKMLKEKLEKELVELYMS